MCAVRKQTAVTSDPDKTKQKLPGELRGLQGVTRVRVGHASLFTCLSLTVRALHKERPHLLPVLPLSLHLYLALILLC